MKRRRQLDLFGDVPRWKRAAPAPAPAPAPSDPPDEPAAAEPLAEADPDDAPIPYRLNNDPGDT